jgi:uncharacterized protein (DUF3820 family)
MTSQTFIQVYISSGAKNGFYTLRCMRAGNGHTRDYYIRTLSTDSDKAERKARAYFDRVYGAYTGPDQVSFMGYADFELDPHGTHVAPWLREQRLLLDAGRWPFGKHKGDLIADGDDGYIRWWAKQPVDGGTSEAGEAVIAQCVAIADERGLFADEEARKAQWAAEAAASNHVGAIGDRREWTLTVLFTKVIDTPNSMFSDCTQLVKLVDADGNRFTYWGWSVEADKGDTVTMRATIKAHDDYNGEKSTILARPAKVAVTSNEKVDA